MILLEYVAEKVVKMKPKIIAMYLPQFHRVPENDAWWGDGFTEWTAVKNAVPEFAGHRQPRIPLNNNYYDLMDKRTMEWQAELAKKYSVDGFAFYHYWFQDGRQILEKTAENLLKWTDIDMSFCFSWANETWARRWNKFSNSFDWAAKFSTASNGECDGILLNQKYGNRDDWRKHIEYLLPFFQDKRYIKYDNRPVFMIYKPDEIYCLPDMLEYWNSILKEYNIPELYLIGSLHRGSFGNNQVITAGMLHMPGYGVQKEYSTRDNNGVLHVDYNAAWNTVLSAHVDFLADKAVYMCALVDYDDSPRYGKNSRVFDGANPKAFKCNFENMYMLACDRGNKFVFINAWNEWGESMYLEPDTYNGYKYLEAIRDIVKDGKNFDENNIFQHTKKAVPSNNLLVKYKSQIHAMNKMMCIMEQNISLGKYLKELGFSKIAVYGYGFVGKHLITLLQREGIDVLYVIDKNSNVLSSDINVCVLSKDMPYVDAIIVTPIDEYPAIRSSIKKFVDFNTISLGHILNELCE